MTRLWFASLAGFASLTALLIPARPAAADCPPGSRVCVEVGVEGSLQVGPPRPSRVVVVEQPAPPPPPPRVIVVETEVEQAPPPPPPPPEPEPVVEEDGYWDAPPRQPPRFGVHGYVAGVVGRDLHMGGTTGAFRFRPVPHLAVDLGLGLYGGTDYNGLDRVEVPLTADMLLFVNPENALQLYFLGGLGLSFAHAEGHNRHTGRLESRDYGYVGGQAGIGLEWRIGRHFALNGDVRAFLRQRVDDDDQPEFIEYEAGRPTGRTTDTSAGGLATIGATFYF